MYTFSDLPGGAFSRRNIAEEAARLNLPTLLPNRAPAMADLLLAPIRRKPVMAYYYVTYKCNARCVFCNIPDGPMDVLPVSKYTSTEQTIEHLDILRELGVRLIDFTGGEPLLRKDIAVLLRAAKDRGFRTQMTTNCTLYPRRAQELKGLVDILCFSLCSPGPEPHNTLRRDHSYDYVIQSMDLARRLGEPYQIIFVLTNDNADLLSGMIELCREKQCILKVQPEWEYFGNDGVAVENLEKANAVAREHNVYVNWAETRVFAQGGNRSSDRTCLASNAVIAISPDGYVLYPCYHKIAQRIKFDRNIIDFFASEKWKQMQDKAGKFKFCDNCSNLCYIHPSFYYQLNQNTVLSALADLRYMKERRRIERQRRRTLAAEVAAE
jgi:MoaA/NifB/PqqE/SkfB family radical SAM enzyme